jgi:uncharacterized protein
MSIRTEGQTEQLTAIVRGSPWFMQALDAGRSLHLSAWCIGAGALRNLVWDHLCGYCEPSALNDIDFAYFDADDLNPAKEQSIQGLLEQRCPGLPWGVTNQAAVHLWFEGHFGHAVAPLSSLESAVASWPEYATSVAVTLNGAGAIEVIAPFGLDDLLALRVRRNPARVSLATYRARTASKNYRARWPRVQIVDE